VSQTSVSLKYGLMVKLKGVVVALLLVGAWHGGGYRKIQQHPCQKIVVYLHFVPKTSFLWPCIISMHLVHCAVVALWVANCQRSILHFRPVCLFVVLCTELDRYRGVNGSLFTFLILSQRFQQRMANNTKKSSLALALVFMSPIKILAKIRP
jgi:hypothetical protein